MTLNPAADHPAAPSTSPSGASRSASPGAPPGASPDRSPSYRSHDKPLWRRAGLSAEAGLAAALAVLVVVSVALVPNFAQPITLTYLIQAVFPILIMVLPVTLIIITGEIDLSVGSTLGLASVVFGLLHQADVPLLLAGLIATLTGAAIGALNGVLVTVVGLPSLAVTIGTLALFRGAAVGLLGTTAISDFPVELTAFAQSTIGTSPIPVLVIPFVVLAVAFSILLHFTPFGRGVYAIGLGAETAHFSGVGVRRTKFLLFTLSGLIAAAVGVAFTIQYGNAIGSNGAGDELEVITAIVLGGVSTFGGRGGILGAVLGVFLIGTLSSALQLAGVGSNGISVVTGAALVLSVISSRLLLQLSLRRRTHRGSPAGEAK